jgi:PAS domain S-box-containing protein
MPDPMPPIDVSPPAAGAASAAREVWLEAILESVSDAFYALDTSWRYVVFNRAAEDYFMVAKEKVLGRTYAELFPQGRGTEFETRMKAAMDDRASSTFEAPSAFRPDRVVELRITPMRDGGIAVSLRDITERKMAEQRQKLLVNELNHRVKNSLATVQAIAAQSLRRADVPAAVVDRFMSRLVALARANDILVAEDWLGADLDAIASQVASPYAARHDDKDGGEVGRFRVGGPEAHLSPKAATAMALALHELATNAAKYGALSNATGCVQIGWDVTPSTLRLEWIESGGPKVAPPQRRGFGTRLLHDGLMREFASQTRMDYAPAGVRCEIDVPL